MDSRTPELKRKRTFSNQTSPNQSTGPNSNSTENHFLYQKLAEVTKELEVQKAKNANFQPEIITRQNQMSHFPAQHMTGIIPRQNVTAQPPRHPSHFAMYANTVPGQAQPKDCMTGQALPMVGMPAPVAGWGVQMGPNMSQWGTGQEFYPANQ